MPAQYRAGFAAVLTLCLLNGTVSGQEPADDKAPTLELKPTHVLKLEDTSFSFSFSGDGKRFAASSGRLVRVWDTRTWEEVGKFEEKDSYLLVYLSPDGRKLAITSNGYRDLKLLDIASRKLLQTLHAYTVAIHYAVFSPDGKMIVTTGQDEADGDGDRVKFWDLESGKEVTHTAKWRMGSLPPLAFSPSGDILAVTMEDGSVRLLDGKKGEETRRLMPTDAALNHATGLTFSPDGRFLVVGQRMGENQVTVWDIREGKSISQLKWPVPRDLNFMGEGNTFVPDRTRPPGIYSLAFAPDSHSLVVACRENTIRVWELSTGGLRYKVEESAPFMAAASHSSLFATSKGTQESPQISVWDFRTSIPPRRPSTPAAVEKLWTALDTRDAAEAFERMRDLATVPKEALAILDTQLRTVDPVKATVLDGLVRELDDSSFEVRDRARRRLEELGAIAKPVLTKALEGKPSAEARRQIKELLRVLDSPPSGDRLRVLRAVEVLEMIGSPEARGVLKRLADGAPEATLTQQAKAALERLNAN